jgi:hypothetical protein
MLVRRLLPRQAKVNLGSIAEICIMREKRNCNDATRAVALVSGEVNMCHLREVKVCEMQVTTCELVNNTEMLRKRDKPTEKRKPHTAVPVGRNHKLRENLLHRILTSTASSLICLFGAHMNSRCEYQSLPILKIFCDLVCKHLSLSKQERP